MKIATFSDIHGNLQALKTILEDIKKRNVDEVICLGDVIGLGPNSDECLDLILKDNIIFLMGNHELYYTKGLDVGYIVNPEILVHNEWVHNNIHHDFDDSKLTHEIDINNKKLLFVHYFLKDNFKSDEYPFESSSLFETDDYKKLFDKYPYDYVFYGHRHEERIDSNGKTTFYGLESSGCTKGDITSYYLIDTNNFNIERIDLKYDRKLFENIMENIDFPNKDHICDYFYGLKKVKKS